MDDEFDLDGFEKDLEETLKNGRIAFMGKYKSELNHLSGLSKEEIDEISPGNTDLLKYDELIAVVKAASSANLQQAELKNQITKLGDIAITIAKRVPTLAAIF